MGLLGICLVVKVHLLLELKRLLELLLKLFKISLGLVSLRFKEGETTLPESPLLIKKVPLFLQFRSRVVKLTPDLLVAVGVRHLVFFKVFVQVVVVLPQRLDLGLVVGDQLLALLLKVCKLLLEHGLLSLTS